MNQRKAGALLSYVYLALTCIVGLFYTPFALYYLGEGEYGVFAIAVSAISFLTILDMGFNQTMIRYVSKYKALGDKQGEYRLNGLFLLFYMIIAAVALIAGIILSFFIEDIFAGANGVGLTELEALELKLTFGILLINLVGSFPLGIYTAILNANEGFVVLKGINILTFVLTYGSMTLALVGGQGVIVLAMITTIVSLTMKLIQGIYVQKVYKPKFRFRGVEKGLVKEVFGFSFFIFLNIVIDQLYANTDKFILGIVGNSFIVSVYTVGVTFTAYFEQFSTSISGVFLPRITKLTTTEDDMKEVSNIFIKIGRIQFIVMGFIMSGFIVFGRTFVKLWVGEDMLGAYAIALVVIIPAIIPLSQNIGIAVIRALNRHRFRSLMYLIIAVFNVALSIPLAMRFGGFGAACATGLGTCLGQIMIMNWFYYKKIGLDIPGYWKQAVKILIVLIPVGGIGFGLHMIPIWDMIGVWHGWLSLILQVIIYSAIFFIAGWLFIFNEYEKDLIRGGVRLIIRIVLKLTPTRDDVMFESHPDMSDNAKAVYEELLRMGYNKDHRIYWCMYSEEEHDLPDNVYAVYKNKPGLKNNWRRLKAIARCRFILDSNSYIHKIKGSQIRLHLGHGMPIKLMPDYTNYDEIGACDGYLTCGTYWKEIYTEKAHVPEDVLVPIGYPRNDVLVEGSDERNRIREIRLREAETDEKKEQGYFWHLPEREKFIFWMPTYRQHKKYAATRNDEAMEAFNAANEEGRWEQLAMQQLRSKNKPKMPYGMPEITDAEQMKELDARLGEYGMKLYFRPHPSQDLYYVSSIALENIRIADDEFLERCKMSLYEVLYVSQALITDYSSVYFDYLLTGHPIGLTISDAGMFFRDCECCFDDLENELGGTMIHSFDEVMGFIDVVNEGGEASAESEAKKWFHDVMDGTSTKRVVKWLIEHGLPVDDRPADM